MISEGIALMDLKNNSNIHRKELTFWICVKTGYRSHFFLEKP